MLNTQKFHLQNVRAWINDEGKVSMKHSIGTKCGRRSSPLMEKLVPFGKMQKDYPQDCCKICMKKYAQIVKKLKNK